MTNNVTEVPEPLVVIAMDNGEYEISGLLEDAKNNETYVERILRPDDPHYSIVDDAVSILNIARTDEEKEIEIEGVGFTSASVGVYAIVITKEQLQSLFKE